MLRAWMTGLTGYTVIFKDSGTTWPSTRLQLVTTIITMNMSMNINITITMFMGKTDS